MVQLVWRCDLVNEKMNEQADMEEKSKEQQQTITKLQSDKSILFREYKKKCNELQSNKRRLEEADNLIDAKNDELDGMACSLGAVINRMEFRMKCAKDENKRLKKFDSPCEKTCGCDPNSS